MKKSIFILSVAVATLFSSCKKDNPEPTNTTTNPPASTLPNEYIIFNDGTTTDTVDATGSRFYNLNADTNNTTFLSAMEIVSPVPPTIDMIVMMPSDSVRFSNFALGTYGTAAYISTGDAHYFDLPKTQVKNGTMAFRIQYNSSQSPYISDINDQTATTSFNKINSITRIKSLWDDIQGIMTVVYAIEGEYKIQVKQMGTTNTKIIQGKYRYQTSSSK